MFFHNSGTIKKRAEGTRPALTAAPQGDPPIKSKDAGTTPTVGPLQPYDGSCPYAQAYIPSKTEAAGRDYKNVRKKPGPANKQ